MKKLIILAVLLLGMVHTAFAEQRGVLIEIHYRRVTGKNMSVNRAPMRLPIEVVYDSDTHKIEVTGGESVEAEVFLCNANGGLENYCNVYGTLEDLEDALLTSLDKPIDNKINLRL